jgi:hypothetical protein
VTQEMAVRELLTVVKYCRPVKQSQEFDGG